MWRRNCENWYKYGLGEPMKGYLARFSTIHKGFHKVIHRSGGKFLSVLDSGLWIVLRTSGVLGMAG